jgi:hypothetical protein
MSPIDEDLTGTKHDHFGIYTGTLANGQKSSNPLNFPSITIGNSSSTDKNWVQNVAFPDLIALRMYGISAVQTVLPEPPSLVLTATAIIGVGTWASFRKRRVKRQ